MRNRAKTIAVAIGRAITTYMGSNTSKKPWTNIQTDTENEAKRLRATTFAIPKLEVH